MYKTISRNAARMGRNTFNSPVYNNNEKRSKKGRTTKTHREIQEDYMKKMEREKKRRDALKKKAKKVTPNGTANMDPYSAPVGSECGGVVNIIKKRSKR